MIYDLGGSLRNPNRIQVSIVLIVAASGGLVALWGDASLLVVAAATLAGLVLGIALTAYLSWIAPESGQPDGRRLDRDRDRER